MKIHFLAVIGALLGVTFLTGCTIQQPAPGMAYARWPSVYSVLVVNNCERPFAVMDIDQGGKPLVKLEPGQTFTYYVPNSAIWEDRPVVILLAFSAEGGSAPDIQSYTVRFRHGERAIPLVVGGTTTDTFRSDRKNNYYRW